MKTFAGKLGCAALAALVLLVCSSCAAKPKRTITVSGTGTVSVQADVATINLAVITLDPSVEAASRANAEAVAKVRADLVAAGYDAEKIVTDGYSIAQDYKYLNGTDVRGDYRVSNSMHIVVRDVGKIGNVIDIAVKAGANEFRSIAFSVSDTESATEEARTAAVQNAQAAAKLMVETAGAKLGEILSIDEQRRYDYAPVANNFAVVTESAADYATSVTPGKQKISVTVVCTYEIIGN